MPSSGYSVSTVADGVELTLHFGRRSYPQHALIAVTATLRNLSHPGLAVERSRQPFGLCNWPAITITSVDAGGHEVEPPQPIPPPLTGCLFLGTVDLPIGQTFVEHQLVALWSSRLMATARVFNHVDGGYQGFSYQGPTARFSVHPAPAPLISIQTALSLTTAHVSLPTGARGPLYYRSWDTCAGAQIPPPAYYWTPLRGRQLSTYCNRWHVDVAVLNMPVATLNLNPRGFQRHVTS